MANSAPKITANWSIFVFSIKLMSTHTKFEQFVQQQQQQQQRRQLPYLFAHRHFVQCFNAFEIMMRNAKLVLCGRSWISVSRCIHTIQNIIAHVHQTALIPSTANFYLIFRYCRYFATFYPRLNIFGGFNVGYAYKTAITRAVCTYGNSYFIRIWH